MSAATPGKEGEISRSLHTAPRLTDRKALVQRRQRAVRQGGPKTFLLDLAREELSEKLSDTGRTFRRIAVVSGFPDYWRAVFPGASQVEDADIVQFPDHTLDLIIHAMALHWSDDPVGQLIQCRRALAPDGLMIAAMIGGESLHELREVFIKAESETDGRVSPRIAPMGDIRDLGSLLQRAGFALPVADRTRIRATYPHPLALMHELRAMGESNALAMRSQSFTNRRVMSRACDIYAADHSPKTGVIEATFDLVFLTGWAPADTQPQPLQPGSANTRLADALAEVQGCRTARRCDDEC